jgi:hypothetical protein
MAFVNLNLFEPDVPMIPLGSLMQADSKLGHELIAGPLVGYEQVVGHKEFGAGAYPEYIGSALQRYQITRVIAPVSNEHGMISWQRMEQQFGDPWVASDNCQHAARRAYYGAPHSPTLNGIALVGAAALLLWVTTAGSSPSN